ncbi:hypothetical protein [Streptomyces sp. LS1784]|uniref:hypothetical protein n=1 Tax=Streptomyces sp. LS1784 TaxID=2851533 RepID=UPI001CCA9040|nr:hypothetical protein [Streptomyces sp. LS1784]
MRSLSAVTAEVLNAYLDRHAGGDDLVERALLPLARHGHGGEPAFASVLAHHSDPHHDVHTLTQELRHGLGGNPGNREAWARGILALPDCSSETVLALPTWTALQARGHRYDTTTVGECLSLATGIPALSVVCGVFIGALSGYVSMRASTPRRVRQMIIWPVRGTRGSSVSHAVAPSDGMPNINKAGESKYRSNITSSGEY